jgi:3D (Asp-Asp-Asp) domain-containing protein
MNGKRMAMVIGISILFSANAANAESSVLQEKNEILTISQKTSYDFRNDPFLLSLVFEKKAVGSGTLDQSREMTAEEKILENWKKKQQEKWKNLPKEKFVINASAYTASADECGNNKGITSSGLLVKKEQTLACPPEYPFGAKISIEGFGTLRCEDRGGAIKGNKFDIYMETKREAFAFGRRNLVAEVMFE